MANPKLQSQIILDAYGKLASKRIIDNVPMLVKDALVAPLPERLRRAAASPTDEDLRELLAETDAAIAARRRAMAQLRAMEAAEAAFEAVARRRFD
jgi:ribosomal protein L12E/L44/L45/RPP1/RPP2